MSLLLGGGVLGGTPAPSPCSDLTLLSQYVLFSLPGLAQGLLLLPASCWPLASSHLRSQLASRRRRLRLLLIVPPPPAPPCAPCPRSASDVSDERARECLPAPGRVSSTLAKSAVILAILTLQ